MDILGDGNECSTSSSSSMIIVGNYILGPRIGSGSFAVVWRSRHRQTGAVVAVKEINKKQLSPKVADNLLKEVSILSNIRHPNIIRLIEAIDTEDRIYLVLEYCEGGDLATYIHRHGKVTEAVARHFMRQLAAGLQVLNENHLIHRDLKPQNLLLSTNEETPTLKIGDFGFARYLTPQGLADTLCGSPLYMAPEIIQNKKYDGKADLWSVGAILFQLVTGKPPFDGDSQLQLFQNILTSSELRFPQGTLQELNPDCVALCRALLRHNPVERLTFEELFNHKFLAEPRLTVEVKQSHQILQSKSLVEQFECLSDRKLPLTLDKKPQLCPGKKSNSSLHDNNDKKMVREDHDSTSRTPCVRGVKQHTVCDRLRTSLEGDLNSSDQLRVTDSMESIEKEYVLVNANFASVESFSCSLETSQLNNCGRGFSCPEKKDDWVVAAAKQEKELASSSTGCTKIPGSNESDPLVSSTVWRELQGLSILHPSTRLQLLNQYIWALSELAQVKFNAGLLLESFSVELVVLAIWKQAIKVCGSWLTCTTEGDLPGRCSTTQSTRSQEGASLPLKSKAVDFSTPCSVCMWAEQGFLVAFDRAQKLSNHLQDSDGNAQMPDAMEIIFQTALEVGKSGAVDELIGNEGSAAASYSKAMILLSFIVGEATSLPLSPPFLLIADDRKRIEGYIRNFESRQSHFNMSQACPKQMVDPFSK